MLVVGPDWTPIDTVEQFAQIWRPKTRKTGVATIFSAQLPAIQQRTVAFAPFLHGMDLRQLELVVAPPLEPTALHLNWESGGLREFKFL